MLFPYCCVCSSCTFMIDLQSISTFESRALFKILRHLIVTLTSRALLGFSFVRFLRQYPAQLLDSSLVSHALLGFSFIRKLREYLVQSKIDLELEFSLIRSKWMHHAHFYSKYLAYFNKALASDFYVNISFTLSISFHSSFSLVSHALLGYSFIRKLR